ncbi:hypothetical protein R6Q59_025493 [Mikania micrantha]
MTVAAASSSSPYPRSLLLLLLHLNRFRHPRHPVSPNFSRISTGIPVGWTLAVKGSDGDAAANAVFRQSSSVSLEIMASADNVVCSSCTIYWMFGLRFIELILGSDYSVAVGWRKKEQKMAATGAIQEAQVIQNIGTTKRDNVKAVKVMVEVKEKNLVEEVEEVEELKAEVSLGVANVVNLIALNISAPSRKII